MLKFKIRRLRDVQLPTQAYTSAAGWDFFIPKNWELLPGVKPKDNFIMPAWQSKVIHPGESLFVPSGLQIQMHSGYALSFENRSGKARQGLLVGATIVDTDYQGEIHLNVWNVSKHDICISCGDKILQGIFFLPPQIQLHDTTEELFTERTARGQNGFGSTGK